MKAIRNGLHVDDFASGGKTVELLWKLYLKVKKTLKEDGFMIDKWKINDSKLRKPTEEN